MRFHKSIITLVIATFLLAACSTSTEDLSNAIEKKVDEEVNKFIDKATEEGKKKVDETLSTSLDQVGSILNGLLGDEKESTLSQDGVKTGGTTEQIPVTFIKSVDGDTIRIVYNGKETSVRYLLTDSPEITKDKNQPFGQEAAARNKELLENGVVTIEFDVGERFDKYNRLLAYIYVDGVSVQETLIREGLSRLAYVYPPNIRYLDAYEKAQQEAKKAGIGIWSIENYSTDRGFKE